MRFNEDEEYELSLPPLEEDLPDFEPPGVSELEHDYLRNKHANGRFGENAACDYLISRGFTIVGRNFRTDHGEIDIIARNERYITFTEVKFRSDSEVQKRFGRPARAIGRIKRDRILYSVRKYLLHHKEECSGLVPRIDVIELYGEPLPELGLYALRVNFIPHVFGMEILRQDDIM